MYKKFIKPSKIVFVDPKNYNISNLKKKSNYEKSHKNIMAIEFCCFW